LIFFQEYFNENQHQFISRQIFIKAGIKAYKERKVKFSNLFQIKNLSSIKNNQKVISNNNFFQILKNSKNQKQSLKAIKKNQAQSFITPNMKKDQQKIILPHSKVFLNKLKRPFSNHIKS